tara:strand:+ start:244 stop:942 length:699 start_codon:yes stop_codon:yes gene_type:complete
LQKTLNSVIHQEIKPKYHIFVDCESVDETKELIRDYKKQNIETEVIVLTQDLVGIYNAWNQGLVYLLSLVDNNHFIIILNSDDWFDDKYISTISRHKENDLIAGSCMVHYEKESFIRPCRNLKFLPLFMPIMDPSLCVKATVFREIGIYRERFQVAADHDFVFRAYEMGFSFKVIKDVLVNVKMGGYAYQNKDKAFLEQLELSRERCLLPIPELAFIYRLLRFPRFRFLDFL